MTPTAIEQACPLGDAPLSTVLRRSLESPPGSPLLFSGAGVVQTSPTLSWVSAESLDSIMSLANRTGEQLELDSLVYRLCHSLYCVAETKSAKMHRRPVEACYASVGDDTRRFHNMRGHEDWCPLRHLFDPSSYYRAMGRSSNPHVGCKCLEETHDPSSGPAGASKWLVDELDVTRLSGGNSNHVYRLGHASYPGKAVLLRVYGDRGGEVIDRARDIKAMQLMSKAKMSPAVLHSFHWGRVEEFMDSVCTCTTEMLLASPPLLADIYEGLCYMHQLDAAPFLPENINGVKPFGRFVSRKTSVDELASLLEGSAGYYSTLGREKALESVCPTSFERASFRLLRLMSSHVLETHRRELVDWLAGEIMFVRGEMLRRDIPVVFSHNDLNPGNILLARRKVPAAFRDGGPRGSSGDGERPAEGGGRNLVERRGHLFIDFEYTDANYRCFDLGNTLCELDYDYTRGTEAGGRGFIKFLCVFPPAAKAEAWRGLGEEYPRLPELILDAWRRGCDDDDDDGAETRDVGAAALQAVRRYFATQSGAPASEVPVAEAQLAELLLGMLASHLHWTLWALVMGCAPDECADCAADAEAFALGGSGLDYVRYGECRLKEYIALRHWLISHALI
ncbi:putative choline ethanolamine kinase [Trypanosoma conorhini]|uniref:Putative choline ethanolamine kinase n=1 Tax=Trypanosoma conorhini TaxID=83891 RepID=A0A422Q6W2_9TRYP|nr:putative choline ethanolamine kinase [Trypanosoma conorhini]RNF25703.1 putative choline ethanolamine kinase [Trypanosoma conorhini]